MIKQLGGLILSSPSIGVPVAKALRLFGKGDLARKVVRCYLPAVPDVAEDDLPRGLFGRRNLKMKTLGGADQVAQSLWLGGWKSFEPPLPLIYSLCLQRMTNVLDVGANTGFYSVLGASVQPSIVIHAFEPVPKLVEHLRENIRLNCLGQNVTVHPIAVGDTNGFGTLYLPSDEHGLVETSASLNPKFRNQHITMFQVPVVTLDTYCSAWPNIVHLIKIDVESHESAVLKGASRILQDHRPVVALEVLDNNAEVEEIRASHRYIAVKMHRNKLVISGELDAEEGVPNQLLWPEERRHELPPLASRAGLHLQS